MPSVDIQILEGVFSEKERSQMITEVTQVFANIAGDDFAQNVSVRIHEIKSGNYGYAGQPIHTEDGLNMRRK